MSQLLDAISGVPNACEPITGIVTGGQPAPEHLAALKRAGCAVVIDLREAMEPRLFKTPDALVQAGLEYLSIPVGHGAVRDATFSGVVDAVREPAGKRPAFVHCSRGQRVGAALLACFMLEPGLEAEDAVAERGLEKHSIGGEDGGDLIHGAALPPAAKRVQQLTIGLGHGAQYTRNLEPPVGTYGRREQPRVAPSVLAGSSYHTQEDER